MFVDLYNKNKRVLLHQNVRLLNKACHRILTFKDAVAVLLFLTETLHPSAALGLAAAHAFLFVQLLQFSAFAEVVADLVVLRGVAVVGIPT